LPWRSPEGKGKTNAPTGGKTSGSVPRSSSGAIAALAARDSRIEYDSRQGEARLAAPLSFDEQTGGLTAASKRELDQLSKLLRADDAKDLHITVSAAGGEQQAQAVADYLDRHGIPQDRLSVAPAPAIAAAAARQNAPGQVRITLSESSQPLRR
jgi:outer membrane protein OmpA-like peptidoglycan-associated protein